MDTYVSLIFFFDSYAISKILDNKVGQICDYGSKWKKSSINKKKVDENWNRDLATFFKCILFGCLSYFLSAYF